jgi:hypothetical protein
MFSSTAFLEIAAMPRPPKQQDEKHMRRWIVRVTDEDDRQARDKAHHAGLKFSAYLRAMGRDGKVMPPDPMASVVAAVNRAGNLVNQQMAIAHARQTIPAELLRLNGVLEETLTAILNRVAAAE